MCKWEVQQKKRRSSKFGFPSSRSYASDTREADYRRVEEAAGRKPLRSVTSATRARGEPLRLISRGLLSMNSIPDNLAIGQLTTNQLRIIAILLDKFVMRALFQEHTSI